MARPQPGRRPSTPRERRTWWLLLLATIGFAVVLVALARLPVRSWAGQKEILLSFGGRLTMLVYVAALGGALGSFLNVVVYRLPAGMSLARPGSRCPACGHAIRIRDNVPVLGWLILGGRCRDCDAAFSVRYACVELISAAVVALLVWLQVMNFGLTLPPLIPWGITGTPEAVAEYGNFYQGVALANTLAYVALLLTLLAAALVAFDGGRLPVSGWSVALAMGVAFLATNWAPFMPAQGWQWPGLAFLDSMDDASRFKLARGVAAGVLIFVASWLGDRWKSDKATYLLAWATLGLSLGFVAAALIIGAASLIWLLVESLGVPAEVRRWLNWPALALVLALGWILSWRWIVEFAPWLGRDASTVAMLAAWVVGLGVAIMSLSQVARRTPRPHPMG